MSARRSRIIRAIWAACLLLAGMNHARILIRHGLFWDYGSTAVASAAYWTSLTAIDPIVALLVITRPRIGIPATLVVIATNVAHNGFVTARAIGADGFLRYAASSPQLISQTGFLIFVLVTARTAWRGLPPVAQRPTG